MIRPAGKSGNIPRIVFISSESHRSSNAIDFENFGVFTDYGIKTSLKFYGISNMQKFYFKQDPQQKFLGVFEPRTISDGERHVLCSGFWGVSRHINYLGEILMSCGLTLALGWPFTLVPWLYPLYYIVFLLPRRGTHLCG